MRDLRFKGVVRIKRPWAKYLYLKFYQPEKGIKRNLNISVKNILIRQRAMFMIALVDAPKNFALKTFESNPI